MFASFYFVIYVLSLPGRIIADLTQNYKRTIIWGIIVMAAGYCILSVPVFSGHGFSWVMVLTMFALIMIACGNGLFKGNLQALVGQMYDDFEAEAAKKGPEALAKAKEKRDTGFQIFYVFINIGGVIAPFIAPIIRNWWLGVHGMTYNAQLPKLCHDYVTNNMQGNDLENLTALTQQYPEAANDLGAFCDSYVTVFNTGVHYSFIASVVAMFLSLVIFIAFKKIFPTPAKKEAAAVEQYTAEEKRAMAKEIKQRMAALFAVLGVCVFFWLSFHQNGQSLSVFARDYVITDKIAPEIWQAVNPFFVIVLTPIIMAIFAALARKGKAISTPRKIVIGMAITGLAYLFLVLLSMAYDYPNGETFRALSIDQQAAMKSQWWVLIATYFFLTVAELFISPLGLSFVSKIAPKHLQGICQGLWLGATALGNLFIWIGPVMLNKMPKLWMCWAVFLVICLVAMGVMWGMVSWLERVTGEKQ
jgi:POT family proton-dependent oligopeptide transporter